MLLILFVSNRKGRGRCSKERKDWRHRVNKKEKRELLGALLQTTTAMRRTTKHHGIALDLQHSGTGSIQQCSDPSLYMLLFHF